MLVCSTQPAVGYLDGGFKKKYVHPCLGKDFQFDLNFLNGLKPPTRYDVPFFFEGVGYGLVEGNSQRRSGVLLEDPAMSRGMWSLPIRS